MVRRPPPHRRLPQARGQSPRRRAGRHRIEEGGLTPDEWVARLGLWLREAQSGVAAVAYREPDTAAAARRRLRPRNRRVRTFTLPTGLTGRQTAVALVEAVEANAGDVLHVVGWEAAFGGPQMGERLYDLNFLRESVMEPPTAQVWWMPVAFRDAFMLLAIDTWSMVKLKTFLTDAGEYVRLSPRVADIVRRDLKLTPGAAIPTRRLREVTTFLAPFSALNDSDLPSIARLQPLNRLGLTLTPVTNVSFLRGLGALVSLELDGTRVEDISPLASLTSLTSLDLTRTPVGDVSPLRGLTALEELHIGGIKATDLSSLENLTRLRYLGIRGVKVSDARVETLRQALPQCVVDR